MQPLFNKTTTQSDSDLQGGHWLVILSKDSNSGLCKYHIFITPKNKAQIRVCGDFPCNVKYLLMQLRQNSRIVSFVVNNHDRTDETIIQRGCNGVSCRREQPNRCHRIYESIYCVSKLFFRQISIVRTFHRTWPASVPVPIQLIFCDASRDEIE